MRIESSITSISWIPSAAIPGLMKMPFEIGLGHYDEPPGDRLPASIPDLAASGEIRFANDLRAWIDVENGRIIDGGHTGKGWIGVTRVAFGPRKLNFPAVALPDIRPDAIRTADAIRFVQTTGGRVAFPLPRKVARPPFVQITPPLVWTTLALTMHADGRVEREVTGASPFPRHWIYDADGALIKKSGTTDFKTWSNEIFGEKTPWGAEDSPAIVTEVETALERELSKTIMRGGAKPTIRKIKAGESLVEQGQQGDELFLLLDGVLSVEVDSKALAEIGPGAILGERALLEGGTRTATLRAVTPARVAVATADQVAPEALAEVAKGHRREDQ
ncbi:MAG: cyclic nucleotide-binding domain-containing protein [Candidatus Dormibacter sp.]